MGVVKDWMRAHSDPASEYALQVLDGEIVACEHMVNAAQRHFNDIEEGKYLWMPKKAERPYEFLRQVIHVLDYDTYRQVPIRLMGWQKFLLWSLHGWRVKEGDSMERTPGVRRFEKVFLTSAKNTGKSAFFAGHMLYLLCQDGYRDLRNEKWVRIRQQNCVISASTLEQAQEVALRPAIAMLDHAKVLTDPMGFGCLVEGGEKRPKGIFCTRTGGRLMAITARKDGTGLGGRIIQALHMEEVTETNDVDRWRALSAGFKNSQQPLFSIATNPSHISSGIAYREYTEARQAAAGLGHENLLGLIFTIDEDEVAESVMDGKTWIPPETSWVKANPGLPYGVPRVDYIRRQIEGATTASERREVLRLNMGSWKGFGNGLLSLDIVSSASLPKETPRFKFEDMRERELYLGLDLARKNDLSALAYLWRDGERAFLKIHSYFPQENLANAQAESSADLDRFVEDGWIRLVPGATNSYKEILDDIIKANELFDLRGVAVDVWGIDDLFHMMDEREVPYSVEGRNNEECTWNGIHFVIHPQGWTHSKKTNLSQETSISAMERLFYAADGKEPSIKVERNPVFIHAVDSSVVKESEKLTRKITKKDAKNHSRGRIDSLIATIMACGLSDRGVVPEDRSVSVGVFGGADFNPSQFVM